MTITKAEELREGDVIVFAWFGKHVSYTLASAPRKMVGGAWIAHYVNPPHDLTSQVGISKEDEFGDDVVSVTRPNVGVVFTRERGV